MRDQSDKIRVRCDCGTTLAARGSELGRSLPCPQCGKPLEVLEPEEHLVPDLRVGILQRATIILIGAALVCLTAAIWVYTDPEMSRTDPEAFRREEGLIFLVPGLYLIAHGIYPGRQ